MQHQGKPFACSNEGCQLTFTNEDHLNIHQKKHELFLNLGLGCTSNLLTADQTPTPTRFIRNCEEVGLFQDLQNINPFEETFKKAVETVKNESLHVPIAKNNDTLHTPQIYPPSEEQNKIQNSERYSYSRMLSIDDNLLQIDKDLPESDNCDNKKCSYEETYTIEDKERHQEKCLVLGSKKLNKTNSLLVRRLKTKGKLSSLQIVNQNKVVDDSVKSKIKSAVENKKKLISTQASKIEDSSVNIEINKNNKCFFSLSGTSSYPCKEKDISSVEKRRASNRNAQWRSRERKKSLFKDMEKQLHKYTTVNKLLSVENSKLKKEVDVLKNILVFHKECPISHDPATSEKINSLLKTLEKPDVMKNNSIIPTNLTLTTVPTVSVIPAVNFQNITLVPTNLNGSTFNLIKQPSTLACNLKQVVPKNNIIGLKRLYS